MVRARYNKKSERRLLALCKNNETKSPAIKQWNKNAIDYLVKKLKRNQDIIDELEKAISQKCSTSKCILIPNTPDYRSLITHRRAKPPVVYCRMWRFPELQSQHLIEPISVCQHYVEPEKPEQASTGETGEGEQMQGPVAGTSAETPAQASQSTNLTSNEWTSEVSEAPGISKSQKRKQKQNTVCINPYHYEKRKATSLEPIYVPYSRIPPDLSTSMEDSDNIGNGTKAIPNKNFTRLPFSSQAITAATVRSLLSENSPLLTQPSASTANIQFQATQTGSSIQQQMQSQQLPQQQSQQLQLSTSHQQQPQLASNPQQQPPTSSTPQQQHQPQLSTPQQIQQQYLSQHHQHIQQHQHMQDLPPTPTPSQSLYQLAQPVQMHQGQPPQMPSPRRQLSHVDPTQQIGPRQAKILRTHQGRMPGPQQLQQQQILQPQEQMVIQPQQQHRNIPDEQLQHIPSDQQQHQHVSLQQQQQQHQHISLEQQHQHIPHEQQHQLIPLEQHQLVPLEQQHQHIPHDQQREPPRLVPHEQLVSHDEQQFISYDQQQPLVPHEQQMQMQQQHQHQHFQNEPPRHQQMQPITHEQQQQQEQQYQQQGQYDQQQQHYEHQHQQVSMQAQMTMAQQHQQVPMHQQQPPMPEQQMMHMSHPQEQQQQEQVPMHYEQIPPQQQQQQIHHQQVPMQQEQQQMPQHPGASFAQPHPPSQPPTTSTQQSHSETEIAQPYRFKQNKFTQYARTIAAQQQPIGTQRSYDRHGNVVSRPYTYAQHMENLQKQQQQYPPTSSQSSYHYPVPTPAPSQYAQSVSGSAYKTMQPQHHPYTSHELAMELSQQEQYQESSHQSSIARYVAAHNKPFGRGGHVVHHQTHSLPAYPHRNEPGQLAINFQEIPFVEGNNWCSVSYHEYDRRLGDKYQAYNYTINVDGYTNPNCRERYCVGNLTNVHRTPSTEWVRRRIGRGVKLSYIDGEVYVECLCDTSIFVSSPLYGVDDLRDEFSERVQKLHSGQGTKVFSNPLFSRLLSKAVSRGFEAVYKLTQLCTFRVSFIKGWGRTYKRQSVTDAPCWVEVQLNGPLQWIDRVLRQMKPPQGCGSTS